MDSDIDDDLLPINPEALVSTARLLDVMGRTTPLPRIEDTAERLLVRVGITFYDFVGRILTYPPKSSASIGVVHPSGARQHALTIANLLTVLSMESPNGTHYSSQNGGTDHWLELRGRWIKAIIEVSCDEKEPVWEPTVASYIRSTTIMLGASTSKLLEEPRVSLDPEEVSGRPPSPDTKITPDEAGVVLVRCAAATLCMAALVAPDF